MKRAKRAMTTALAVSTMTLAACGAGQQAEKAPAAAPVAPAGAAPEAPADMSSAARGATATTPAAEATPAPAPAPAPPPPAAAAAPTASGIAPHVALQRARAEIDAAQRALETSAGDCTAACRALGSMDRATGHLCDLASDADDRRRCDDAKTRVLAARERVKTTCGSCPGGPSVERTAPIPSR